MPRPTHGLVEVAIEGRSKDGQAKLVDALALMAAADTTFSVLMDDVSGQIILAGDSDAHLDAKIDVLKTVHGIDANVGAPQVAYRETLSQAAEIDYSHKLVTPAGGEFARVTLLFEPGEPNSGEMAESRADHAPLEFVSGAMRGVEAAAKAGLIAGFPVIDFKVTLVAVAYHDLDSSGRAFEIAAQGAFRELREKGAPVLLEPIMKVEVITPDEFMGDVIGDMNGRRGHIQSVENQGDDHAVTALTPLSNMFWYAASLQAFSQGRTRFSMTYDHYAPLPRKLDPDPDFSPAIGMRLRA